MSAKRGVTRWEHRVDFVMIVEHTELGDGRSMTRFQPAVKCGDLCEHIGRAKPTERAALTELANTIIGGYGSD